MGLIHVIRMGVRVGVMFVRRIGTLSGGRSVGNYYGQKERKRK